MLVKLCLPVSDLTLRNAPLPESTQVHIRDFLLIINRRELLLKGKTETKDRDKRVQRETKKSVKSLHLYMDLHANSK